MGRSGVCSNLSAPAIQVTGAAIPAIPATRGLPKIGGPLRQLWEIDENLMRSELTPTQLAEHLAKRKELWEARTNNVRISDKTPGRPKGFFGDTAKKTGVSRQRIHEAVARAEGVTQEARETANTVRSFEPLAAAGPERKPRGNKRLLVGRVVPPVSKTAEHPNRR